MNEPSTGPLHALVVFVDDKVRVTPFYVRTAGLVLRHRDDMHDVLEGRGIEVVIHGLPEAYRSPTPMASPPPRREDVAFKPAFIVDDLAAVRAAAEATGGQLNAMECAFEARGWTLLDGCDPEGNMVQFRQRVAID